MSEKKKRGYRRFTLEGPLTGFCALLRLRFFSSTPRPNMRRSLLAGLVDAMYDAIRMKRDMRGNEWMLFCRDTDVGA